MAGDDTCHDHKEDFNGVFMLEVFLLTHILFSMRTTRVNIFLKVSQKTPTNHAKLLTKLFPFQPVTTVQTSDCPYR